MSVELWQVGGAEAGLGQGDAQRDGLNLRTNIYMNGSLRCAWCVGGRGTMRTPYAPPHLLRLRVHKGQPCMSVDIAALAGWGR
jgi:hypothetical protein